MRLDGITASVDVNLSKRGESERQGSLACYSPWGHKELDMTWRLNNNNDFSEGQEIGMDLLYVRLSGMRTQSWKVCRWFLSVSPLSR